MIREANLADIPRLVEMGRQFIAESTYKQHLPENPKQLHVLAEQIISNPKGAILVSESEGKLTGMLALITYPHPFSGELVAGEVFWWVDPEARKGRTGLKLMRRAEKVAIELGAKKMQMVAPTERIARLYERLGYEKVESTYQTGLSWQ
ncbi:hypothetical protein LCGC14_0892720 [marine sediment metagenome]|uniref:N-acetyltransferase domain-containing protein n=1 Tax=marine sediment metagenome TaxID=412755 RepID=A0A0F9RHY9_9ZZZZ